MKILIPIYILIALGMGILQPAVRSQVAHEPTPAEPQSIPGTLVTLRHDPTYNPWRVLPPDDIVNGRLMPRQAEVVRFSINFNPAGACPVTHPANSDWKRQAWPSKARESMELAGLIWSALLNGGHTIVIDACWYSSLGDNVLGQAGPTISYQNFQDAPQKDTFYPVALANQLADKDLNGTQAEIGASFSADFEWYFEPDGKVPFDKVDFLTVALHEIGHGVGFSGSANWDDGEGSKECDGTKKSGCISDPPYIYDRFVQSSDIDIVGGFENPSIGLGNALIGDVLFFNGPIASSANGDERPRLFAPDPWNGGSSFSHLDEATFNNTQNSLMTPVQANGEALHHPGPVGLGVLADLGWRVNNWSQVWVNKNHTGQEWGTSTNPFNTVKEGAAAVNTGGNVWIVEGSYNERITISRQMVLRTTGGQVTIGR